MTKFFVGGVEYTSHLSLPLTIQTTLNDQLDTAMLTLACMRQKDPFRPFTDARIVIDGKAVDMVIASDNATEVFGTGLYTHELTLIEKTKIAERILCEAKAFTQPLVHDYSDGQTVASYELLETEVMDTKAGESVYSGVCNENTLFSPIATGLSFQVPFDLSTVISDTGTINDFVYGWVKITHKKDQESPSGTVVFWGGGASSGAPTVIQGEYIHTVDTGTYGEGCYTVEYSRVYNADHLGSSAGFCRINIYVASKIAQKPRRTIDEVCKELFDIAEPLRDGLDSPRFRLDYVSDEQRQKFESMESPPQLVFSNGRSLWENLREIGRIVHGIPRIEGDRVLFDELGSSARADMSKGKIFYFSDSYNASDYTAAIEAVASNLINTEDASEGAISDPFEGGYRTLRTESETARIKDETGLLYTAYPIERIISARFVYRAKSGERITGDIAPYIFEKTEYDLLSSFSGGYPSSKTYALYYTQGAQNVRGLWYRAQDSGSQIVDSFERPAIANVIAAACGVSASSVPIDYADLSVSITYITSVSARVRQHRTSYDGTEELVMAYNQSANKMSSRAFGEALRGQVAMMGTTSTVVRCLFRKFSDIPAPGTLYDDDNYISSVTARVLANHCVCEIALSTGYNELGAYTEMNNAIRQYEIPAGEKRYTVLEEFCVIGDGGKDDENIIATYQFRLAMLRMLEGDEARGSKQISSAVCKTYGENGDIIRDGIVLPVVSYSIGNCLYFGFEFENNVSAGKSSEDAPTASAKYRLQKDVPYADPYYANAEKISFSLYSGSSVAEENTVTVGHGLPSDEGITLGVEMATLGDYPLIWHKDSADSASLSYQVHFVSDRNYIIGSGLARSCPYARNKISADRARIYFFDKRINQLTGTVDTSKAIHVSDFSYLSNYPIGIKVDSMPSVPFESWAMIRGGEFLFGKNSAEIDKNIYFKFKRRRK